MRKVLLNIRTFEKEKMRYFIYDLHGQLRLKGEAPLIDTGSLTIGMYIIHVQYGEEVFKKKLLKQK